MATLLYLRNTTSASVVATPSYLDLSTTAGAAEQTATAVLTNGGTEIQWNRSGALALSFLSGRVPTAGLTLTAGNTVTYSLWAEESNSNDNAGLRAKLYQFGRSATTTLINSSDFSAELTTTLAEKPWSGTLTSTFVLAQDERLMLQIFAIPVGGTMTSGTAGLGYNGGAGANGDSFVELKPDVTFKAESDPPQVDPSTITVTTSFDALLFKSGITKTSSLDALLEESMCGIMPFDAVLVSAVAVTSTFTNTVSLDGLLLQSGELKTTSLDGLLFKSGNLKTTSLDGLLFRSGNLKTTSLDGLLFQSGNLTTTSLDGLLFESGIAKTASLDGLLFQSGETKTVSLDAQVGTAVSTVTTTLTLGLDSRLAQEDEAGTLSATTSLDAILGFRSGMLTYSMDGHLFSWYQRPTPTTLYWDPYKVLPLTNPTTYSVSTTNTTFGLSSGEHAIFALPKDEPVLDQVSIVAGPSSNRPRVWVIGGRIENPRRDGDHKGLHLNNVDAYVEGVYVDKLDQPGDAFAFMGSATIGGTLWLQNCVAVGVNNDSNNTHGDALQLQSQVTGLYIDRFRVETWSRGLLWDSDDADMFQSGATILGGFEIRRTSVEIYASGGNTFVSADGILTGHIAYNFVDDCSYTQSSGTLTDVWAYDPDRGLGEIIRPVSSVAAQSACAPTFTGAETFLTLPASTNIVGGIRYGTPPASFVTHTGLGYESPWIGDGEAADLRRPQARPSILWSQDTTPNNRWISKAQAQSGFWDGTQRVSGTSTASSAPVPDLAVTSVATVSMDALLERTANLITTDFDALVTIESEPLEVDFDALLEQTGKTKTTSLDAGLFKSANLKTTSLNAVLAAAGTGLLAVQVDGLLLQTGELKTTSFDGLLFKSANLKTTSLDALLTATGETKTTSLDAMLNATETKTASLDGLLFKSANLKTTSLDAELFRSASKTLSLDVLLKGSETKTVSLDAVTIASPDFGEDFSSAFDTDF
jgi:hypothetical protein